MENKLNFSADYLLLGEKDTLIEVWDKALTPESTDKQLLLSKLFCEMSLNNSQIEGKEDTDKYNMILEKINRLM